MFGLRLIGRFGSTGTNFYKFFNIPVNFSEQELKTSYLELVKKYHPDLSKEADAAEMFRLVQEGYAVLSDATTRIKYQQAHPDTSEIG
jgi:DnaJ-class molecular chaperone